MCSLRLISVVVLGAAMFGFSQGQDRKPPPEAPEAHALRGAITRFGTSRMRHGSRILSLAYSPNGKILAAGGGDDPVRLWDTETGDEIRQCTDRWVTHMVFSAYGSLLATAGPFHTIRLWHVSRGREIGRLKGHTSSITALALYKEGLLASGDSDGVIRLWELSTALEITQLKGHIRDVSALAFSSNGKQLISGGADGTVRIWDAENLKLLHTLETGGNVNAVAMSPDRKTIFSGGDDGLIRLWSAETTTEMGKLDGHKDAITSLVVHVLRDDDLKITSAKLISASRDRTIQIRELDRPNTKPVIIMRHAGDCDALAVSPDARQIASAGLNNTISRWELATGNELPLPEETGHRSGLTGLALSPDGSLLVSASAMGKVRTWQSRSGRAQARWSLPGSADTFVAFSADGEAIAGAVGAEPVRLFKRDGKEIMQLAGPPDDLVLSLAFSPNGKTLAVAYSNGSIRMWDCVQGKPVLHFKFRGPAHTLAFSPNGATLAVSGKSSVALFSLDTGKLAREFSVREGPTSTLPEVTCLAFSPDPKVLGIASYDGIIRLWNLEAGKEIRSLEGHQSAVYSIAFSPDGRHLVSGSFDRTVRLWETFSGQAAEVWPGHAGPVTAVAFAPTGRVVFSGSADTTLLSWDVTGTSPNGELPSKVLQGAELQAAWNDLSSLEIWRANRAIWNLVASAESGAPFLAKQVFVLDRKQLVQQLNDLNDTNYRVREKATKELASYGRWIEGVLREALKTPTSEEARRRLDGLLQKLIGGGSITLEQERLRARRAMLALEQIANADAVQILQRLATGSPEDDLCEEAKLSLTRLAKRGKEP